MHEMAAQTEVSAAIAKDLRPGGGNFVGPTIIYASCRRPAGKRPSSWAVTLQECAALGRKAHAW